MPVAAPGIGFDQQVIGFGVALSAMTLPPAPNGGHRQLRGRRRRAHAHQGVVGALIVDPIGGGSTLGITGKIIGVDDIGRLAITRSRILEVANQFVFLGIHADDRLAAAQEPPLEALDQPILAVALRMGLANQTLDIGFQRIAERFEQPSHRGGTAATQPLRQTAQAAARVFGPSFWIASRLRLNQCQKIGLQPPVFFLAGGVQHPRGVPARGDSPPAPPGDQGDLAGWFSDPSQSTQRPTSCRHTRPPQRATRLPSVDVSH